MTLRTLEELANVLRELDEERVDTEELRARLRPKELDYACTIAAILFAYGICGYEDLPDDQEECD